MQIAFPGCSMLYKGITLFSTTNRKGGFYQEWRKEIIGVLLKYRGIDLVLKEKLQNGDANFFYLRKTFYFR